MEPLALRHAAMISAMTFDQAANVFERYQRQFGEDDIEFWPHPPPQDR